MPLDGYTKIETKRQRYDRRFEDLKSQRTPFENHWQDLADYTAPKRLRLTLERNMGKKIKQKIIDSTGTFALRTLASGMHSGITSPARPWFKLTTRDKSLRDFAPVKSFLSAVEFSMREVFSSSNIYNAFHWGYGDLGLFGQSCGLLIEDADSTIRMIQLLHGSFWLVRDSKGRAVTLFRHISMTVEQMVLRFGYEQCSRNVRNCYDNGRYDERFTVNHAVERRRDRDRDVTKQDKRNKPWASVYWEDGARDQIGADLLEDSGFDSNPIIAPPWELIAEDHYATSPGMDALPDVKMLQVEQRWKGEGIERKVRPPMVAPTSLRNNPVSNMPNSVTYVDDPTGKNYRPAISVDLSLSDLREDMGETRQRVERAFYADLFLMLANMEGVQPRNDFEIAERKEEKLLALGPVLENIFGSQLAPTIERTYEIMDRRGMLPEVPRELDQQPIKIEYTSILAQAQKAVATGAVERLFGFVGNLAGVNSAVLDKVDMDEGIDVYGDMIGAPPSIIVPDDKVVQIRKERAEAERQAAAAENAKNIAPAAKQGAEAASVLAETDARSGGNLLENLGIS